MLIADRDSFELYNLVYDTFHKTWVPTSSCLWSKDAQIPGKVTILSQYGDLKDFFVGTLKVKIPDLGMLVEELSRVVSQKLTVDEIKSLIWQINSFSPSRKALEKVKDLPIFPVKITKRKVEQPVLRDRRGNFSIIDRQPWADAFHGKVDFLDFTLEEVRKLQPLLSSLDLDSRYLSRAVAEKSSFQGEVQEQSRIQTRQLRSRAHALARRVEGTAFPQPKTDYNIIDVRLTSIAQGFATIICSSTTYFFVPKCTKQTA